MSGSEIPELEAMEADISRRLLSERGAVFLDYDGTLTPIVDDPRDAVLAPEARALLQDLSRLVPVGVISGRDLDDVRARVGIDGIWYGGSHGFDLAGPGGWRHVEEAGEAAIPALDAAEAELGEALGPIRGTSLERKRFSLAVHYRRAPPEAAAGVERAVDDVLGRREGLRKTSGKKVFELRPDADWDKGRALLTLLEALGLEESGSFVVFAGDDVTDEDAFRVLRARRLGVGLLIGDADGRGTLADARLEDTEALMAFLRRMAQTLASSA